MVEWFPSWIFYWRHIRYSNIGFSPKRYNLKTNKIMELTALGINNITNLVQPLVMRWQPKEDITTYELAKCLPYLLRQYNTMPYEINKSEKHFRHFEIIDHNIL
jgi:hypothetical protein